MGDGPGAHEEFPGPKIGDDVRVGLLDEPSSHELRGEVREAPPVVHGVEHGPPLPPPGLEVLGPEGRRQVDDAGPLDHGHEVARDDPVRRVALHGVEEAFVGHALEARALERGAGPPLASQGLLAEGLRHDVPVAAVLHERVRLGRMHRQPRVRDQRPGRRRPPDEMGADELVAVMGVGGDGELHEDAGILDRRVPERHLMVRERRLASRAPRDDLVVLEEQPPLVQASE